MTRDRRTLPVVTLAALAAALVLAAGPRRAAAHDTVRLSVGVANQWAWTDSVDALQRPDRFLASEVRLGVGVWEGLSVEAGYRSPTGGGDTFAEAFDTDVVLHTIDLAVRYDWPLLSWLSVYGRAGGTYAYVETDVSWATARLESTAWTPGAFAGGGVGVRFPRRWFGGEDGADGGSGFTLGLAMDVGYAWFADVALSGRPTPTGGRDGDTGGARIQQSGIDLGTLRIHGLTLQLGLTLHY